jgi:hypothetical protein
MRGFPCDSLLEKKRNSAKEKQTTVKTSLKISVLVLRSIAPDKTHRQVLVELELDHCEEIATEKFPFSTK